MKKNEIPYNSFQEENDLKSAGNIQVALKDLLGGTIKEMIESEMDIHLGYDLCCQPVAALKEFIPQLVCYRFVFDL